MRFYSLGRLDLLVIDRVQAAVFAKSMLNISTLTRKNDSCMLLLVLGALLDYTKLIVSRFYRSFSTACYSKSSSPSQLKNPAILNS